MKRLTMVLRMGEPKASPESMYYNLIGEDYSAVTMSGVDLVNAIRSKQIEVTNLEVTAKGLASSNGALSNYTQLDTTGKLVNEPRAVILNRVENAKGLVGYTIYNLNGVLQEINVAQAAELAKAGRIANGKVRHTQQGDIVASINGNYPLRILNITDNKDEKISVSVMFIGSAIGANGESVKYAGVTVEANNAAYMSKIHSKLAKSNKEIVDKAVAISKDEKLADTLGIKRISSASFYGVYSVDVAFGLIEKAEKSIKLPMGRLMIACTDYSNGESIESNVALTPDFKAAGKNDGTEKANTMLKAYVKTILGKLQGIKVVK